VQQVNARRVWLNGDAEGESADPLGLPARSPPIFSAGWTTRRSFSFN